MRKLFWLLVLLVAVAGYLHNIQGWDLKRARTLPGVSAFWKDDSATTTPIGQRGVGTHWETATAMPSARTNFGTAIVGDKIYVLGGHDGYLRTLDSVVVYDIATDTWSDVAPLPQAMHHPAVASDGKSVFVLGGMTGFASRPLDVAYAYDPIRNVWEEIGQLNDFRGDAAAAFLKDRLYVLGGTTTAGSDSALEFYDTERKNWNGLPAMPTARHGHALVGLGETLYALGGRLGTTKDLAAVEAFSGGEWKTLPEMPVARSGFGAVVQEGKILVVGGSSDVGLIASIDVFDPKKSLWSSLPVPAPHPRRGVGAVIYKNRVYVIGGGRAKWYSVSDLNEVLILDPKGDAAIAAEKKK